MASKHAIQACERQKGDSKCPHHARSDVCARCNECGVLVCLDCMTSAEHEGHQFKQIKECLREANDSINKHLHRMGTVLLPGIKKRRAELSRQITANEREMQYKVKYFCVYQVDLNKIETNMFERTKCTMYDKYI